MFIYKSFLRTYDGEFEFIRNTEVRIREYI